MTDLLIDVTRLIGRRLRSRLPTGIDRVALAYVQQYRGSARAVVQRGRFVATLTPRASQGVFSWLLDPEAPVVRAFSGLLAGTRSSVAAGTPLINVNHSGIEVPGHLSALHAAKIRPIFMVHDLIPITHPQYCRPHTQRQHIARMRAIISGGAGVLTNSQATLVELERFAQEQQLTCPPVLSAPLAPALIAPAAGARPIPDAYFVVLATIEPRKNHLMLLQLWPRLAQRLGAATPKLVVIGQRGWECENVVDLLERSPKLRPHLIEQAHCTDAALNSWLTHAQALLFPSFVEGFGLPLAEALARGTPVIASDLPVFREIAGAVPEYLDPLDGPAWERAIEGYSSRSAAREAQLTRMTSLKLPTWDAHFTRFERLLSVAC